MESITSHFSPIILTFSTKDVTDLLSTRANLNSFSSLLAPFQSNIQNVTVRSSSFDSINLPSFPVRFQDRQLPSDFATRHNRSNSTTLPPAHPPTPFIAPNQAERDELFLDSLSDSITHKVDYWIANGGAPELNLKRPVQRKKLYRADSVQLQEEEEEQDVDEGWKGVSIDQLTPWYTNLRDQILARREMVEWETFAHPVACLLVVSTDHPDPLNALSALWELTSKENLFRGGQSDVTEWANPDVLRYVVLVHDTGKGGGRDALEDAQQLHATISKTYLHHTALLPLFSASQSAAKPLPKAAGLENLWPPTSSQEPTGIPPYSPEVFGLGVGPVMEIPNEILNEVPKEEKLIEIGQDLSEEDLKNLRMFVREMVVQSIVPWVERAVVVGNEQFTASKRSIGGRLFSAGRKYFGSGASGRGSPVSATGAPLGYNPVKAFYPIAAQESQTRRLADLAFMIGDYKLAASVYEQASRDFRQDKAWKYYASACRMTGLAHLLLHPLSTPLTFNPDVWLEQALQTPSVGGGVDLDGLKSMMLYYEAYRTIGDWRPAPAGLVRTAGESDELASALLLEQAAIADLNLPMPSRRKFGFHMAMAAARYEKCGLKSLSRRCLSQGASLYRAPPPLIRDPRWTPSLRNWQAIRAHLHYGLGRQAYNVGKADEAVGHFLELLVSEGESMDEAGAEENWLDDFGLAWEHLGNDAESVIKDRGLKLQATVFHAREAHIRVSHNGTFVNETDEGVTAEWAKLEEELGLGNVQKGKRPTAGDAPRKKENVVVVGETFYLELVANNPLNSPLAIGGLVIETDAEPGSLEIDAPQEIELEPRQSLKIYVPVRASFLGTFSFTKLSYRFNDLLPCTETLVGNPIRLNSTRAHLALATYAQDSSLKVVVRSLVPILSVTIDQLPSSMYAGEGRMATFTLTNTGQVPLTDLRGLCSHPSFALFQSSSSSATPPPSIYQTISSATSLAPYIIPNHLTPNTPFLIPLPDTSNTLAPGSSVSVPALCRGDSRGSQNLHWIFAFRNPDGGERLSTRASHQLEVLPSLEIRPVIRPGNSLGLPFLIGIEIQNSAVSAPVVIDQIASVATRWQCQSVASSGATDNPLAVLEWQQSANLFVGVAPVAEVDDEGTAFSVRKLDDLLQGKDVTTSLPGPVALHIGSTSKSNQIDKTAAPLFPSILRTHVQLRHRSLSNQLPTIPVALHEYLFTLFNPRSIDLLVFWSIPSLRISGHHHLADIPLGAGSNKLKEVLEKAELKAGGLYAESQRERSTLLAGLRKSELGVDANPSELVLEVEELIEHDFQTGPCFVTVSFYVRNLSTTQPLTFTLSLQHSDMASTREISSPTRLPYVGALTHRGQVSTLSFSKVEGKLWISKPGSYNVGDWRLDAVAASGLWQRSGSLRIVRVVGSSSLSI